MATNEQLLGTDAPLSAFVKLETQTASNSASLDFTTGFDTTKYMGYVIYFNKLLPATDGADIGIRVSTDGGSTWDSGASDYYAVRHWAYQASASYTAGADNHGRFGTGLGNVADSEDGMSGKAEIWGIGENTQFQCHAQMMGHDPASNRFGELTNITRDTTQTCDAFQLVASTGNISSGTVTLFGIPK